MTTVVFVALGANIGDRHAYLTTARARLAALPGTHVRATSSIEETAPIGAPGQGAYLNQMLAVETVLAPAELLAAAQAIERAAGRVRDPATRWGPRTLDIDLVHAHAIVVNTPELQLPHPEIRNRDFWQRELAELGVDWRAVVAAAHPSTATSGAQYPARVPLEQLA